MARVFHNRRTRRGNRLLTRRRQKATGRLPLQELNQILPAEAALFEDTEKRSFGEIGVKRNHSPVGSALEPYVTSSLAGLLETGFS
jgi:hypothetical protein